MALSPTHIFYIAFELTQVSHYVDHSLFFETIGLYETIFSYSPSFSPTSCVDSFPYTQLSLLEHIKIGPMLSGFVVVLLSTLYLRISCSPMTLIIPLIR